MEREVGGGIGMGNTCKPMAVSFQCMTKFTTNKKKSEISGSYGNAALYLREWPYCFPYFLYHVTFPPAVQSSYLCISSPTLVIFCGFDSSHSNMCERISHCS